MELGVRAPVGVQRGPGHGGVRVLSCQSWLPALSHPVLHSGLSQAPRRGIWAPMGAMGSAGSSCVPGGIPGLLACCPHPKLHSGGYCERRPVRPPGMGHCPRCPQGPHLEQPAIRLAPRVTWARPAPSLALLDPVLTPGLLPCLSPNPTGLLSYPGPASQAPQWDLGGGLSWVRRWPVRTWASGLPPSSCCLSLCATSGVGHVLRESHLFWLRQKVRWDSCPPL